MAEELSGRFLNRTPLKGRWPRARNTIKTDGVLPFFTGDTIRLDVQVFDETGTPQSLENAQKIVSTWKEDDCLLEYMYQLTVGDGITVLDPANGRVRIELTPEQTAQMIPISYVFDLEITLSDGTVGTVLKKWVEMHGDVTWPD